MRGHRGRGLGLASLALLVIVLFLAGCGDGGGGTTGPTKTTGAPPTAEGAPTPSSGTATDPGQKPRQSDERARQNQAEPEHPTATRPLPAPPTASTPLPNKGTKNVAPGVPTPEGADNSIQSYGLESESADRLQAASVVKAYLDAQAAGRWSEACSYLSAELRARLEELAQSIPDSSASGCAAAMGTFLADVRKDALATVADIEVLSMRVRGKNAFLIYRDGEALATAMVMSLEGGTWRVGALAGNPLTH
jgi:hypothetical protein